eukprot:2328815-Amphidinium_carterae.1
MHFCHYHSLVIEKVEETAVVSLCTEVRRELFWLVLMSLGKCRIPPNHSGGGVRTLRVEVRTTSAPLEYGEVEETSGPSFFYIGRSIMAPQSKASDEIVASAKLSKDTTSAEHGLMTVDMSDRHCFSMAHFVAVLVDVAWIGASCWGLG